MKRVLLLLLFACCLLIAPAAAAGGAGTAANPYIIETPAELQSIQNNLAAYYVLANDIDLQGYSFTPIGSSSAPFTGSLDGDNYTISNFDYSGSGYVGLFRFVSSGATIKDIIFNNCVCSGTSSYVSVVIGAVGGDGSVSLSNLNLYSCSVINGGYGSSLLVGGIVNSVNVEINNCNIHQSLLNANSNNIGGLVGAIIDTSNVKIDNCNVDESIISGSGNVGGAIGGIGATSIISDVFIYNSIINSNTNSGGIVGTVYGTIGSLSITNSNCNNCIIIGTNSYSGGIIGDITSSSGISYISNCNINYVSVSGSAAAGIIGAVISPAQTQYIINCIVTDTTIQSSYSTAGIGLGTVNINSCNVDNTNIYGSVIYDIGPSGSYDSTSTATGITNVPNRYLYASGLSYSTSGNTATLTLDDRQGAAVIETSNGAAAAINYDYGDGNTGTTDTHTYSAGIYTAGVTISSYLQTTPLSFYTTPINIGIPTYTANTITQQDADIVIDAGQLYQAQTQFVLPSTTSDLEFFADNVFVVASGNAVYLIDTATEQIEPVSNTTGTTAEKIYLGEHAAIITDIDGNTAVYQYAENSFDYLSSGDNQQIATTQNYAGIIINGELNIYDLSEPRKIGDISASVTALAGNDYADTFAGYSGTTFYYWWIDNGEIKSGSQTMPNPITEVKQIPQTQNYIITTEKNTITVSVSSIGDYSKLSTSATELPLTHVQATTIGVTIGVHAPNEIYIVGADGSTAGTYQTGATLNDASISKATGLYAITGGIDQQAYILRKDQSSTWALAQTIRANGVLSHTQISTNGQYAAIVNGVNLYLLKLSTSTDTIYYLQGVVISSTGSLYANKVITINGEKVTTDLSGRFTYAVTPGSLYRIVADTTTTEYTATNTVLQTIAIKLKPNPFAQSVSYSTDYNADTRNFEMTYTDTRDTTSSVTWIIRETGNQTIVSTQTVQAGQTAYWEVPLDKSFTSYQISMIADRQGANVENVWIITPEGKNPINIPGLDDTGRNIIFGAVLMIFGGLFGVMHSTKGAIITVAFAGVLTYLGLLTIPWPIIMIAGTLAVLAALAKGSGGS